MEIFFILATEIVHDSIISVVWMHPPPPRKCTVSTEHRSSRPVTNTNYCFLPQRAAAEWSSAGTAQPQVQSPVLQTRNHFCPFLFVQLSDQSSPWYTMTIDPSLLFPSSFQSLLYSISHISLQMYVCLCVKYIKNSLN